MTGLPLRIKSSNPFYLISATCMLAGCLAISHSNAWNNFSAPQDLMLILTLNLYEAALIALAWYLVRRRRLIHDGIMLVSLEAFFLVDIAFLNAEAVTSNFAIGVALNILLFIAAIVKLSLLAAITGLKLRNGWMPAATLQLAALFAMPMIFRHYDHGDLPDGFLYAAWWAAGLLIPLTFWLSQRRTSDPSEPWVRGILRLLCILPWISLVLHLSILHYVYNITYQAVDVTPILLGVACLLRELPPTKFAGRRDLLTIQAILPAIAVSLSLANPDSILLTLGKRHTFTITPTELALAAAYLTYINSFARRFAGQLIIGATAAVATYIYGPSTQQITDFTSRAWNWIYTTFLPKTAVGNGIAAIVAAFAFLGLGAILSSRRRSPNEQETKP